MENENHFDTTLPYPLVILGLILMPLGMVEQVLVIAYEMFGMDPMKRGIVNRVRMKWAVIISHTFVKFFISYTQ